MKMRKIVNIQKRVKQQVLALFLCGFVLGIFLANLWLGDAVDNGGIMSQWFLSQFSYTEIEYSRLFCYVLEKRIKTFCILVMVGFTGAGSAVVFAFLLWLGICIGAFFSICIMQMGILGIFLAVMAFFPQIIMYLPVFLLLLWMIENKKEPIGSPREGKHRNFIFVVALVLAMIVLLSGICMESYVNPLLLKKIIGFL